MKIDQKGARIQESSERSGGLFPIRWNSRILEPLFYVFSPMSLFPMRVQVP
jgi:hypothetical protein